MKTSLPSYFKLIFVAGAILIFISLFVDWYTFQMFHSETLTVSWNYNIIFEWSTDFPSGISVNERYRPENLEVPPFINFLCIAAIMFTLYTVFFKDLEQAKELISLKKYSIGFVCLIVLSLFYIVIFPVLYLIANELYFPSLVDNNLDLAITFSYSISYGYVIQLVGCLLIFPYSVHYYITITQFERQENTPEKRISSYLDTLKEQIDFDRYIAEEEELA